MARISVRLSVISILAFVLLIQSSPWTKLLNKNVEEVQKITVINLRNGNRTSEITQEGNEDLINTIYQIINTTKIQTVSEHAHRSVDPYFTITLNYSDGTEDIIYSGESSNFISKGLSGSQWIGGKNNVLIEIVNRLTI